MSGYIEPNNLCSTLSPTDPMYLCSGCDISPGWEDKWVRLNCPLQFSELIVSGGSYSQDNLETAQRYSNQLFENYNRLYSITDPGSPGYNEFQDVLLRFCSNYSINPGICQNYLQYQQCLDIDYDTMSPTDIYWCGCFVDPDDPLYGDNEACYPTCQTSNTIQKIDESDGNLIQCDVQVCIIDNVSVTVEDSRLGSLDITSVCPSCSGNCDCIINNVSVEGIEANITQYCGDNLTCYQIVDGVEQEVNCGISRSINWSLIILIIFIIIAILTILIIIILLARR